MAKRVLVLRTCNPELTSYNGFKWPRRGKVEAPDWDPKPECGNGLHGALWGEGDGSLFNWWPDAVWQVVSVDAESVLDLGGKVKFPRGSVVHTGTRESATAYILERAPGRAVIGALVTAGYKGTATAGYKGTATAGDYGMATAGNSGTATAGNGGTATAGDYGTATAGDYGTATAGNGGTATAGNGGTATAGNGGEVRIRWYNGSRFRLAVGYTGEDNIKSNTPYKVVGGKLVEVAE